MWNAFSEELHEIVWLLSINGGLSIIGVAVAVVLAQLSSRLLPAPDRPAL